MARQVVDLLAQRHRRDLFFAEVKDGPTHGTTHLRLDALAIAKSWSPVQLMGYEVKVSRSDWLGDRKWTEYLGYATTFSLVAPAGVLELEELPPGIGYVQVSETGKSLRTVRKAAYRDIDPPALLLLYLLMSRMVPGDPHAYEWTRERRIEQWKEKLERDRECRRIGYAVGAKLRERIEELERAAGPLAAEAVDLDNWLRDREAGRWCPGTLLQRVLREVCRTTEESKAARRDLEAAVARAVEALAKTINNEWTPGTPEEGRVVAID